MRIPDGAIESLKRSNDNLEREFSSIWAVLPPSVERDTIMWHIMTARHKINEFVKENA